VAFVHGSNQTLSIDATDVSAYTDNVSLSNGVNLAEVSAFGDNDQEFIAGLKTHGITCSGHYDATADAAFDGMFDGSEVAFSYSPDAGTTTYAGNALITDYSVSGGVGDKVSWSASLQPSGAVTRT
jgi:predicted secreted protein